MDHCPVALENRAVTRAVPGAVSIIPSHCAALVGAAGGEPMGRAAIVAPHGDLLLVAGDDAALVRSNLCNIVHKRLRVTAPVKVRRCGAGRVVEPAPRGREPVAISDAIKSPAAVPLLMPQALKPVAT